MRFQHFEIKSDTRQLLIANNEVSVGARAFDVLSVLAAQHGQVVSKQTLLDIVWPDVVVEENNLQVQISALRKLLGTSTITTVPGRGYCLSAQPRGSLQDIEDSEPKFEVTIPPPSPTFGSSASLVGNLPAHVATLYGRQTDVKALTELLDRHRLITITGSGGMGKTHLAKTVAAIKREAWADGVWWLDVTAVQTSTSFIQSLAACFRIGLLSEDMAQAELAQALGSKQLLLVLDNCEHILQPVNQVISPLLQYAPELQVLVTSQARLHASGEYVYQLGTLAVPSHILPCEQAIEYGAIQLFTERVQQLDRRFRLSDDVLPDVLAICQKLDGVALAIELAAARVPMLGAHGVRERLGERLKLLIGNSGSGQASERQATMRATLDWSYRLLSPEQTKIFRCLSVFVGSFSLEGAKKLLCDETLDEWEMLSLLESLVHKSLVVVTNDSTVRYRMLETHRLYALSKLHESGESLQWQQRFVTAMVNLCRHLVKSRSTKQLWDEIDHIRSAYDWAVLQTDQVNHAHAIALATASAMLLLVSGFASEACTRLLKVESWVDNKTPPGLAARYWQWLGRSGVHGRIATSRCIDAFIKSEKLFQSLNDWRHVHACRRMRAEALIDSGQLAKAKTVLLEAQAMETTDWPIADRMRRLKVQGLLAAQTGQNKTALRHSQEALSLAQMADIERYVIAIQLDIANLHLKMDELDKAHEIFQFITTKAQHHHYHRVTVAEAYAGLVTLLIDKHDLAAAAQICLQALPHWRNGGLFLKHGDLLACWLSRVNCPILATRFLSASNTFFISREIKRDVMSKKNYDDTVQVLSEQVPRAEVETWINESAGLINEKTLADSFESELRHYLQALKSAEIGI